MVPVLLLQVVLAFIGHRVISPELQSCVSVWQHRLHLEDWRITVNVVPHDVLEAGAQADIEPNPNTKEALIRVMRVEDSDLSGRLALADQEVSIVHELVHLEYFAHPRTRSWSDEGAVINETCTLLRRYHRVLAFEVCECSNKP